MPRPGTRFYECEKRDWHSDKDQPMRGSIIQQLFRVLHECHSPVTKKNKEWQEKLPIMVLKAEEIMYLKASSEAEYMDFHTLGERVNDAVNTIIRRDKSTEAKDLLPPCVDEAGLNLSYVPVRASRSQRHTNTGSYFSPKPNEPACSSSKILNNPVKNQNHQLPLHLVNQSNQSNPLKPVDTNPPRLLTGSKKHILPNNTNMNIMSPNGGSVYPLYHGTQLQILRKANPIILGTPIFPSTTEPPIPGCFQNQYLETNYRNNLKKKPEPEFDLSLRLGCSKEPFVGPQKGHVNETNKETSNDPSGFGTSRWSFEGEGHGARPASKKHKV